MALKLRPADKQALLKGMIDRAQAAQYIEGRATSIKAECPNPGGCHSHVLAALRMFVRG